MIRYLRKEFIMSKKSYLIYIILLILMVFRIGIMVYARICTPSFEAANQSESADAVSNPYCGFYHLYGYQLSEEGAKPAKKWASSVLANDDNRIVLLQINLIHYKDKAISDSALTQLDSIISSFAAANKQIILRFLYDWDGNALQSEPSSIEQISSHMDDVSPVVNAHKDAVFLLQGIFTGNCGEMNQTHYGSNDDIRSLMKDLASVISPEIYLSVRTPAQLRTILETSSPFADASPYDGSLCARLGLFNDGMFGNEFDCGTYDDTPLTGSSDFTQKGTRKEEIAFQSNLCPYVPNGGEAVLANPYNDLTNAIPDLYDMRVSYLSCDHEASVLNKWKNTAYPGEDTLFSGRSGYDYIRAHLGYRYVITGSQVSFSGLFSSHIQVEMTVENRGFSPCYRPFDICLSLQDENGKIFQYPVSFDTRTIDRRQAKTVSTAIKRSELSKGTYSLSLSMSDIATKNKISFANASVNEDGSVPLGTLIIP